MDFNTLFFPAPSDSYTSLTHFGELIYLPKIKSTVNNIETIKIVTEVPKGCQAIYIPCLWMQ